MVFGNVLESLAWHASGIALTFITKVPVVEFRFRAKTCSIGMNGVAGI